MKLLHSALKSLSEWNLTKSHATRSKSAKYKTHVIKEERIRSINLMAYHMTKLCSFAIKKF